VELTLEIGGRFCYFSMMAADSISKVILVKLSGAKRNGIEEAMGERFEVEVREALPALREHMPEVTAIVVMCDRTHAAKVAAWISGFAAHAAIVVCASELTEDDLMGLYREGVAEVLEGNGWTPGDVLNAVQKGVLRLAALQELVKKDSDRKIQDSEALYHSLVESLSQNIIRKDLNGRFTFANSNFCKSVGVPIDQIKGKTDADLFLPSLAKKYQEDDRRVIETGSSYEIEEAHKTPEGDALVVKVVKTPVFNARGEIVGTQGIFWDITAQKRAESELAASRERFEVAVKGTADGIWDWNTVTDRVYFSNRFKELLGYQEDEFGDDFETWVSHLHPEDREFSLQAVNAHLEDRVPYDVEHRLRLKNGGYQWFRERGMAIWNDAGKATRMAGSISDIAARRKAQEELKERTLELERSNHDLEQFAYIASHDLKEPLRMVSSYVGLLERRYKDSLDDDAREFIRFAVDGARRMKLLIEDLLVFSRVGTKGKELVETDSKEAAEYALLNLEVAIAEASAIIKMDPDTFPLVMGDSGQLTQLFQNLVGNAIKFSQSGQTPEVTLSVKKHSVDGRYWKFQVSDNGIGIDAAHTERIFEIFQRLHLRAEYAGTGIGLAVARKIVERHQGTIWVESKVGEGATFCFTLLAAGP
jgi:PAS domain S-box-containing protein